MPIQTTTDLTPIIGLERVSTNSQDMARQDADLERLTLAYPIRYVRTIKMQGLSGRHVQRDPEVQQVLEDLRQGRASGIGISALDRLFRAEKFESLKILDVFRDNRRLIYSAKEGLIDPCSDAGWMILLMAAAQAGMEWRTLRQRTMDGKEEHRKLGLDPSGSQSIPRGVIFERIRDSKGRTVSGVWKHDGIYSEKIKQAMYLLCEQGTRPNFEEIIRRIGGGFSGPLALKRSLQNRIWISERVYATQLTGPEYVPENNPDAKPRRKLERRSDPLIRKIDIPALVPLDVFNRVQEIILSRHTNYERARIKNSGRERFLANGLLKCAVCGKSVYVQYGRYDSYYCSSRKNGCKLPYMRRERVDGAICELFTQATFQKEVIQAVEKRIRAIKATKDTGKGSRDKALAKLAERREAVNDMREMGKLDRKGWIARIDQIEKEERELQALAPPPVVPYDAEKMALGIASVFNDFGRLSLAEQKSLLHFAVSDIILDANKLVTINFKGGFLTKVSGSIKTPEKRAKSVTANSLPPSSRTLAICCDDFRGNPDLPSAPGPDLAITFAKPIPIPAGRLVK